MITESMCGDIAHYSDSSSFSEQFGFGHSLVTLFLYVFFWSATYCGAYIFVLKVSIK